MTNKKEWKRIFNIGYEYRGNAKKPKRKPKIQRKKINPTKKDGGVRVG